MLLLHLGEGQEVQQLLIFNVDTRCGWVVSVMQQLHFTPGEGPPLPKQLETEWNPELVWTQKLEEKTLAFPRHGTLVIQPAVKSLYYLSYPSSTYVAIWPKCEAKNTHKKLPQNKQEPLSTAA
jgi:hypothetical protein